MGAAGRLGADDRHGGPGGQGVAAPGHHAGGLLHEEHYRSLLRLAALLTGDAAVAEAVVADAMVADAAATTARAFAPGRSAEDRLRSLQQVVVLRCRRAGRYRRAAARRAQRVTADFARLPVVVALAGLPRGAREAVVLTHYLDLPAAQAAVVAGVSEALLSANLAAAMLALDGQLTAPSPDS
jgi:DNA-directed RNA polymerase specialized sigma24 family protein